MAKSPALFNENVDECTILIFGYGYGTLTIESKEETEGENPQKKWVRAVPARLRIVSDQI